MHVRERINKFVGQHNYLLNCLMFKLCGLWKSKFNAQEIMFKINGFWLSLFKLASNISGSTEAISSLLLCDREGESTTLGLMRHQRSGGVGITIATSDECVAYD